MSVTYITNPPTATPTCTQIQGVLPFTAPEGYDQCEPCHYPGLNANTVALGQIGAIIASSAILNQLTIDNFNQTCINWQNAQLAAWEAAGEPATWVPTTPAPVAQGLPMGDFTVVWDPNVIGQAWFSSQATNLAAGTCPTFAPPVPAAGVPYILSLLGVMNVLMPNGKMQNNTAVFSLQAGKDTVPTGGTVQLLANMTYGNYTYTGQFGIVLELVQIDGAFGKEYYFSTTPVVTS
jgi:hypothetical protein